MRRSALIALLACAPAALHAQHEGGHGTAPATQPAAADSTVTLFREALGTFHWPVRTASAQAQAYFDQGARLMFAFAPAEARRSFAEARRLDPTCAMCWWGEAWSVAPYLNGPMRAADAPDAVAASRRARELAAEGGTPAERALTEAMAGRFEDPHTREGRLRLDSAYANAMAAAYERFPRDAQVATMYAEALMLLEPRRGIWPLSKPSIPRILDVLSGVLAADLGHPGACHLFIHATETTPRVAEAAACGDLLSASMPRASHINHMPSHTFNRIGRWSDAVRVNQIAVRSDSAARTGDGISVYAAHNQMMLAYAAAVDGQSAVSLHASDGFAELVPDGDGASLQATVAVRFGRWNEALALTAAPSHPVHRGLWAFGRGYAHLRTGRADSAAWYLARVDSLAAHTPESMMVRVHSPARLLGVVANILRGEIARSAGRRDEAVAAFRRAVELEDELQYDEPEPLPFAARDWLGAALLEAGQAREAAEVYAFAVEDRPGNGWSLWGLERALRAAGRTADADAARARLAAAWVRADVQLPSSRF
ncbi:MAG TPA: hypothetical protein VF665_19510 [Longimicrobium sp.]|jgi:hypothetical protein|uniref:hypothetical protein n=1 Tax=Longimicrobium sp. TaxID=2029185 RepID=UPI002ED7B2A0